MMRRRSWVVASLALMLGPWLIAGPSAARGRSACKSTAWKLLVACQLDVHEELNVTIANCLNISDADDRSECRDEASSTRGEDSDLCRDQFRARNDVCEMLGENRYDPDPLLDPTISFIDPADIPDLYPPNPYVSLEAGRTYVLRAGQEGDWEETVVVHVTDETREISGVPCRVVVDIAVAPEESDKAGGVEYVPVEATDDWLAQDDIGNVYYCGEKARNFEDGTLDNLDGSFESGEEFAKAGTLIRRFPAVDEGDRQEYALNEAEDVVFYVDLAATPSEEMGGENPEFPCAPDGCVMTHEFAAIEPEAAEFKFYREGVGFVLAVGLEDDEITGEREELVCTGDSLEILSDESCGIEDPEALLGTLCKLSPDVFCENGGK